MIRIDKAFNEPVVLTNRAPDKTNETIALLSANRILYTSRVGVSNRDLNKLEFDNGIYGDQTVKDQLMFDQHDKCCFCEGKFKDNGFGDVEHFRPKGAYKKYRLRTLTYPGYYWLAYSWQNLMYSCEICNRAHKKNSFPLENEDTRKPYHDHQNNLEDEDRLLINPLEEDPSDFIVFDNEMPLPRNGSLKGKESIKTFGLERLNLSRLENLKAIKIALALIHIDETNANEVATAAIALKILPNDLVESVINAKELFNSAALDTAKFAYCVRCKFPQLPTV